MIEDNPINIQILCDFSSEKIEILTDIIKHILNIIGIDHLYSLKGIFITKDTEFINSINKIINIDTPSMSYIPPKTRIPEAGDILKSCG